MGSGSPWRHPIQRRSHVTRASESRWLESPFSRTNIHLHNVSTLSMSVLRRGYQSICSNVGQQLHKCLITFSAFCSLWERQRCITSNKISFWREESPGASASSDPWCSRSACNCSSGVLVAFGGIEKSRRDGSSGDVESHTKDHLAEKQSTNFLRRFHPFNRVPIRDYHDNLLEGQRK